MLGPINTPAKTRRILTYDLEWIPETLELRLIGVFDGSEYRTYTKPLEFLRGELTMENSGSWYFAHAGGLADFQFLLETLVEHGYCVKAAFSGSSAIIVEITEGQKSWLLIDSYWLLRSPLKKIGEAVGIKKLKDYMCPGTSMVLHPESGKKYCDGMGCDHPPPEDLSDPWCIFFAPMPELKVYNEQDNRILWTAIVQLQDGLMDMGSELCMTQASSAMKLYRRSYLNREIRTNKSVNERARVSYVGSRVEVYAPRCEDGFYYDVNSSFPFAMTFPAPGSLKGGRGTLPTGESEMFLADVELEVPEMYLPPIPWRHPKEHRVYFPTGKWRTWLWGIDVRLLEQAGGRITKCHRVLEFDQHRTLEAYARDLYERRKKATTEFEKMLYKLLLNSLYGKFGENPLKQSAYFNPENSAGMNLIMPGVFTSEEIQDIAHEHVPISSHITAFARRTLYKFNKMCLDSGHKIFYNDSVSADRCVVVRDPKGRTHVLPVERLWDRHADGGNARFDGKEEASLAGWTALSKSIETGKEGFFPIRSIIRHKAGKQMHLVSTKEGQTEVTSDHGIMVKASDGRIYEECPEDFVRERREFVRVMPTSNKTHKTFDLYEDLEDVKLVLPGGGESHFVREGEWILREGSHVRNAEDTRIQASYRAGSPELHALLRVIGAFVSEGSASLCGTITPSTARGFEPVVASRHMFSIGQKDLGWLEGLVEDMKAVAPDAHLGYVRTRDDHAIRNGGATLPFLFAALCGEGHSRNRRLPRFCLDLSREDFLVLWEKLFEGDGHAHWEGYRTYTTISRELGSQLSYLLSLHGFDHAISYREDKKCWTIRTRNTGPRSSRKTKHEVREAREDEYVYDLSVEGGGTFVDAMGCVLLKNTDSCVSTMGPSEFNPDHDWIPGHKGIIGPELGQMKLEYIVRAGQFVAPKIYQLDAINLEKMAKAYLSADKTMEKKTAEALVERYSRGELAGDPVAAKMAEAARGDVLRAKGFSRMTMGKFHDLVEGREIEVRRMSRVRELLNRGDLRPTEGVLRKRLQIRKSDDGELHFKMRSKRAMIYSENNSRPWDVSELYDGDAMAQAVP